MSELARESLRNVALISSAGAGKTSLAELIAGHTKSKFLRLNAASAGVKDVRAALDEAGDAVVAGHQLPGPAKGHGIEV